MCVSGNSKNTKISVLLFCLPCRFAFNIDASAATPCPRFSHAATATCDQAEMILFGGVCVFDCVRVCLQVCLCVHAMAAFGVHATHGSMQRCCVVLCRVCASREAAQHLQVRGQYPCPRCVLSCTNITTQNRRNKAQTHAHTYAHTCTHTPAQGT